MKTKLETYIAERAVQIIIALVCVVFVTSLATVATLFLHAGSTAKISAIDRKVTALDERPVGGARTFYYIQGCEATPAATEQEPTVKMSEPMRMRQPKKKSSGWGTTDFDREIEAFEATNQESDK